MAAHRSHFNSMPEQIEPTHLLLNGASLPFASGAHVIGGVTVAVASAPLGSGQRIDITLRNTSSETIHLHHAGVRVTLPRDLDRVVLEHGFMTGSPVRRCRVSDVRADRAADAMTAGILLTESAAAGRRVVAEHFLLLPHGVVGFLDGRSHLSTILVDVDSADALAVLDGVDLPPGAERELDPMWIANGSAGPAYSELATHWGRQAGARTTATAPLGWCSWYMYEQHVTPAHIRSNLALAATHGLDVVQIDYGYSAHLGDWLDPAEGWEPIGTFATEIADAGLTPGIWTAPFVADSASRVAREHPDWFVRGDDGEPIVVIPPVFGPDPWYALDTTQPAVLEHIRTSMAALRGLGFTYHKVDFCFAVTIPGHRHDPTMTRAEALRAGLQAVRDGIGDDAFLLGCGCALAPAVGIVDAMRIAPDTSPQWEPVDPSPPFPESTFAARNAVATSILRSPLHRRLFVNDPDCLILRTTQTELSERERSIMAATAIGTGGFVMLSDDLALYGDAEWAVVERLRSQQLDADHAVDIDDPFADRTVVQGPLLRLEVTWPPMAHGVVPDPTMARVSPSPR